MKKNANDLKQMDSIKIGERLKILRTEKEEQEGRKISQEMVSMATQIGRSTISAYERGERNIHPTDMRKLCIYYNVSADYLLCLTDVRQSYKAD